MFKKIKGFKWMNGFDGIVSGEYYLNGDGTVKETLYTNILALRPTIQTEERMMKFMRARIVPENRSNLKEWLDHYGLEKYDVEEIFIKTQGRTTDDPFYADIIFKGEV